MTLSNTSNAYGSVHKTLHWLMALLIISQFIIAWMFTNLPKENPLRGTFFQCHVLIGATVLLLVLFRIFWRANNPEVRPAFLFNATKRLASQSVHLFIYVAMLVMPISGYFLVTAKGHAITAFGLTIPPLLTSLTFARIAKIGHIYLAYFLLGAIASHFILNRAVVKRML